MFTRMSPPTNCERLLKLMIIGDSAVGKTSLLLRFADDSFSDTFISTIGIDFKVKTLTIDNKPVKLQIWDTAGQERFQTLTASYYRGAMGILVVYDITKVASLENVEKWMYNIVENSNKDVILFLIGAKADLENERAITYELGEKMAKKYGIPFYETSAKNNTNVSDVFHQISQKIYRAQIAKESRTQANSQKGNVFNSLPTNPIDTIRSTNNNCCQ